MHNVSRLVLSIDPLFKFQSEIGLVQTVRQGRVNVIYSAWGGKGIFVIFDLLGRFRDSYL